MNFAILSDEAKIVMGQSPPSSTYNTKEEGLPFFQGKADFGDLYPTPRVYCSEPNSIAEPGDILITVRAPVGPTNLNRVHSCIGRGLSAIRVGSRLDRIYLLYFLRFYEPELAKAGTGSTFTAISRDDLENIKLPFPPLPEQRRIANLLARADRQRRMHRYARQLGDSYLQSVFVEMFGEPVMNPMGWKSEKLENVCTEITVGYVGPMTSEYTPDGVVFLRSLNIKPFRIDLYDIKYISPKFHRLLKKSALYPGDIVVVRTGNAGTAAIIPEKFPPVNCADLVIIRPSLKINNLYLTMLFNSTWGKGHVSGNVVGQIQQHFNIGAANEMVIPLPPLNLQERFAQVVSRYERLRAQQAEAERQAEMLFQSLLAQAFS